MSKVLFTVAIHRDGTSLRPQFVLSTNNMTGVQMTGLNPKTVRIGNPNRHHRFPNRFEYAVSGNRKVTKLSLIVNTSMMLPHVTWASKPPAMNQQALAPRKHRPHSDSGHSRRHPRRHGHHADPYADAAYDGGDGFDGGFD